jgi:hypothetical protein
VSDDRRFLQQPLFGFRQRVDARGENGLDGRRDLISRNWFYYSVVLPRSLQDLAVHQRSNQLFHKEWIAARTIENEALETFERRIRSQQRMQKRGEACTLEGSRRRLR